MFFRLLLESFRRQRRRKLLAGIAILLGATAVTAMLALATTIGDRIHQELAVYGANIIVTPQAETLAVNVGGVDIHPATGNAFLHESDLAKLRTIFWANNITAVSPELSVDMAVASPPGGSTNPVPFTQANVPSKRPALPSGHPVYVHALGLWFDHDLAGLKTGAPRLHPAWKLSGTWPTAEDEIVLGSTLAAKLNLRRNQTLQLSGPYTAETMARILPAGSPLKITGILTTGDVTDQELLMPLSLAQRYANLPDAVERIEITARTRPEDAFARQNPDALSPKQHEIWYCRPYANSIAYQIREAIPNSNAQQVRRVEQSEGNVLKRISGLMWLISAAALFAAGFAVSAAMATAVLERRSEIGLMRSLGASQGSIALLFYLEAAILAIVAGALGYLAGSALAAWLGGRIFPGDQPSPILNPVLLPVVAGMALLVAIAGSTPAIRSALRLDPSSILRNGA